MAEESSNFGERELVGSARPRTVHVVHQLDGDARDFFGLFQAVWQQLLCVDERHATKVSLLDGEKELWSPLFEASTRSRSEQSIEVRVPLTGGARFMESHPGLARVGDGPALMARLTSGRSLSDDLPDPELRSWLNRAMTELCRPSRDLRVAAETFHATHAPRHYTLGLQLEGSPHTRLGLDANQFVDEIVAKEVERHLRTNGILDYRIYLAARGQDYRAGCTRRFGARLLAREPIGAAAGAWLEAAHGSLLDALILARCSFLMGAPSDAWLATLALRVRGGCQRLDCERGPGRAGVGRWSELKRLFANAGDGLPAEPLRGFRTATGSGSVAPAPAAAGVRPARFLEPQPASSGGEDWILTATDAKYWPTLTCFLASLRDVARYRGRVGVFDYGLEAAQRQRLIEHDAEVIVPRNEHLLVIDRYLSLADCFGARPEDTLLYFDADIWFADSIDELFEDRQLLSGKLAAAKDVWYCDYYFKCSRPEHHATIEEALAEVIRDYGQTLQAGFIAGTTDAWLRYASLLRALLSEGFAENRWGADALALNLYAALFADRFELLPITYNAPLLWGVVRDADRFLATQLDADSLHRPGDDPVPVKAIHCTSAARNRMSRGLRFGDVHPALLQEWRRRLGP